MNVENLSLNQWFKALRLSHLFTLAGFMVASGVAGHTFGTWSLEQAISNATAELRKEYNDLLKINGEWADAKKEWVDVAKSWNNKYKEADERGKQWQKHAENLEKLLSAERSKVEALRLREAKLNSCQFTQDQIENITHEIRRRRNEIESYAEKYRPLNEGPIAALETRLSGFQESLRSCNALGL